MRVVNLAGKVQYLSPRKYLENASLLVIKVMSDRERLEVVRLMKAKVKNRKNMETVIRDNDIESMLLE